jgi:hypothetical protein
MLTIDEEKHYCSPEQLHRLLEDFEDHVKKMQKMAILPVIWFGEPSA